MLNSIKIIRTRRAKKVALNSDSKVAITAINKDATSAMKEVA